MNNLEKLNKAISSQKSTWEEEAKWREANEEWLSQSFDIAVRVLDTLREKKMTQKDLAEKLNVSPQFINKIVKGQENLSLETIAKLSRALGIKLIQITGTQVSEVSFDAEKAYQVIESYRREIFRNAIAHGQGGLVAVQVYKKEQKFEYKISA